MNAAGFSNTRRLAAALWLTMLPLLVVPAQAPDVRDDLGRPVRLATPAQRIVTLAPHATELVIAAGAADRLVGVAPVGDLPPTLAAVPRIGGPGALNREALLALRPDLVIAWQSGNRAADLAWIVDSGIALYRSEPGDLTDIAAAIRAIGALAGREGHADRAAAAFQRGLDTPCARLPAQPVYVEVWDRPAMSVGGRHWLNAVLHRAGYRNVFGHLDRGVFRASPEAVHAHRNLLRLTLVPGGATTTAGRLAPLLSRPGPRLADAVQQLCMDRLQSVPRSR